MISADDATYGFYRRPSLFAMRCFRACEYGSRDFGKCVSGRQKLWQKLKMTDHKYLSDNI
jgi:hypothetical protein